MVGDAPHPPKVACAYNAGGIVYNDSPGDRWTVQQSPINSCEHADRFVRWFNACFVMLERDGVTPNPTFYERLRNA